MAKKKKVVAEIKLHIPAGQANPAPPVGPALSQHQVNIMEFCKAFNAKTKSLPPGQITPVVISVFANKTFSFELKSPPASILLKEVAKIAKGSGEPNKVKVAKITKAQLKEVAEKKIKDLNTDDIEKAMRIIAGTARSMGIMVEE